MIAEADIVAVGIKSMHTAEDGFFNSFGFFFCYKLAFASLSKKVSWEWSDRFCVILRVVFITISK